MDASNSFLPCQVCDDVTSLICDVLPYTECETKMYEVSVNATHWQYIDFPIIKCKPRFQNITHIKKRPECVRVPKYHCSSKWKVLDNGTKVPITSSFSFPPKLDCRSVPITSYNTVWYSKLSLVQITLIYLL